MANYGPNAENKNSNLSLASCLLLMPPFGSMQCKVTFANIYYYYALIQSFLDHLTGGNILPYFNMHFSD